MSPKKIQNSLPFMYDIFVCMQFERAVPWHRDSLRREIREAFPSLFFYVCQLEVKPLPMQQLKCCHILRMPIHAIFMISCNPSVVSTHFNIFLYQVIALKVCGLRALELLCHGALHGPALTGWHWIPEFLLAAIEKYIKFCKGACIVSCTVWR